MYLTHRNTVPYGRGINEIGFNLLGFIILCLWAGCMTQGFGRFEPVSDPLSYVSGVIILSFFSVLVVDRRGAAPLIKLLYGASILATTLVYGGLFLNLISGAIDISRKYSMTPIDEYELFTSILIWVLGAMAIYSLNPLSKREGKGIIG